MDSFSKRVFQVLPKANPLPTLWKYVHGDESVEKPSWKYLGFQVIKRYGVKVGAIWQRNPYFEYEHLSPY